VSEPWAITIPKIDASSTLVPLGLTERRELEVPPVDQPLQAGYYAGENTADVGDEVLPGEQGSAVVAGHVDGTGPDGRKGFPGVFARLGELGPGDDVLIDQADGGQLRFVVERVGEYDKDSFPSADVYQVADQPRLNLVTCSGPFDRNAGHYERNTVIFAVLA